MAQKSKTTTILVSDDARLQTDAEAIETLLIGFGEGDLSKVRNALNLLGKASENELHVRVTQLTEEFHTRLSGFRNTLSSDQITMTTTNIPDAAKKLEYVLSATNDATHKLFSMIEVLEGLLNSMEKRSNSLTSEIVNGNEETRKAKVAEYAEFRKEWLSEARAILSEMVIGQEHQDLCGQALSKVLKMVKELETNLIALIKQFGIDAPPNTGLTPDETKVAQDGVDDLLKQLGF